MVYTHVYLYNCTMFLALIVKVRIIAYGISSYVLKRLTRDVKKLGRH